MARPREEGIKWFPYHSNTLDDKTFISLVRRYGGKAFTLFHFIKGEICRASYYMKPDEDLLHKALFLIPELTEEDYHMLLGVFIEKDLFDRDLYEQYGVLTSAQIQNDYFHGIDHRSRSENFTEYLLVEAPDFEARAKKKAEKKTSSKTAKTTKKTTTKKASKKEAQNSVQTAEQEDVEPNCRIFSCKNREEENRIDENRLEEEGAVPFFSQGKLTNGACAPSEVASAPREIEHQPAVKKTSFAEFDSATPTPVGKLSDLRNGGKSSDSTSSNREPRVYQLDDLVKIVLRSKKFCERLCNDNGLKIEEIPMFIDKFKLEYMCGLRPEYSTPGAFFGHFKNWIKYNLNLVDDVQRYNELVAKNELEYVARYGRHLPRSRDLYQESYRHRP
jgi:hypothetical protein